MTARPGYSRGGLRGGPIDWLKALIARWGGGGRSYRSAAAPAGDAPADFAADATAYFAPERDNAASSGGFPSFQSSATDRVEARVADNLANLRVKLRNAYTPSVPVIDRRRFAGRSVLLNTVVRALEEQRMHVIVFGDRGIGKTSLLHVLSQAARDARYIVVYISCGEGSDFDGTIRTVFSEIPLLYHTSVSLSAAQAEKGRNLTELLEEGPATARQAAEVLAKLTGTRVLVILDEFDRVESKDFRREMAELIKNLSDRSARAQLIIAGVATDATELFEYIPSIRRNVVPLQVPQMASEEVLQIIHNGEQSSGITFEPEAVDFVLFLANGSPYLTNLLSHHSASAALDREAVNVAPGDVSGGAERTAAELEARVSRRTLQQLDHVVHDNTREILGMLAGPALFSGGQFTVADVRALYTAEADVEKCLTHIEGLAAQSLLVEVRGEGPFKAYRFLDDGLHAYLWVKTAQQRFERTHGLKSGSVGQSAMSDARTSIGAHLMSDGEMCAPAEAVSPGASK